MPRGMRVPENYSGNAFRQAPHEISGEPPIRNNPRMPAPERIVDPISSESESLAEPMEDVQSEPQDLPTEAPPTAEPATPVGGKALPFGLRLPFQGLFRGSGISIGFEELLLIGLILLISQEGKNDDLVWLLLLLLFIP